MLIRAGMQTTEYELMRDVQHRHWWWLGRQELLRVLMDRYLTKGDTSKVVADVGSGYGANSQFLSSYGNVFALEASDDCLAYLKETAPWVTVRRWKSPEPIDVTFDAMLLADVLEHFEDDVAAARWISRHLNERGVAFITVPAHMYFWSEMDEVVHHFRRYSKQSLLELFAGTDLVVEKISFYNSLLWPVKATFVLLARILRFLQPEKPKESYNDIPNFFVNAIFKAIMFAEARAIRFVNFPIGVSLVLVIRKV